MLFCFISCTILYKPTIPYNGINGRPCLIILITAVAVIAEDSLHTCVTTTNYVCGTKPSAHAVGMTIEFFSWRGTGLLNHPELART